MHNQEASIETRRNGLPDTFILLGAAAAVASCIVAGRSIDRIRHNMDEVSANAANPVVAAAAEEVRDMPYPRAGQIDDYVLVAPGSSQAVIASVEEAQTAAHVRDAAAWGIVGGVVSLGVGTLLLAESVKKREEV